MRLPARHDVEQVWHWRSRLATQSEVMKLPITVKAGVLPSGLLPMTCAVHSEHVKHALATADSLSLFWDASRYLPAVHATHVAPVLTDPALQSLRDTHISTKSRIYTKEN